MSSNPGSLGVYAELIPRVDGFVGAPEPWEEPAYYPAMPVTQDQIDRGMQQVGVLFLIALVPMILSALLLSRDFEVLMHGQQTTGVVVDFRSRPRGYATVAAYFVDGKEYRTMTDLVSRTPLYDIGDEVPIRYLDSKPEQAIIDSAVHKFLFPGFLFAVGGCFMIIAAGCGVHLQRKARALSAHPA